MKKVKAKRKPRQRRAQDLTQGWPAWLKKATQYPGNYIIELRTGARIEFAYAIPHPHVGKGWDHTEWAHLFDVNIRDGESKVTVPEGIILSIQDITWMTEKSKPNDTTDTSTMVPSPLR